MIKIQKNHGDALNAKFIHHLLMVQFLDHLTGAHTNKMEGNWLQARKKFKDINGCCRINIKSYLDEFIWRHNKTVDRLDSFDEILREIGQYYPADGLKLFNLCVEEIVYDDCDILIDEEEKDGTWAEDEEVDGEEAEEEDEEEIDGEEAEVEEAEVEQEAEVVIGTGKSNKLTIK